jgi:hypothetical protein
MTADTSQPRGERGEASKSKKPLRERCWWVLVALVAGWLVAWTYAFGWTLVEYFVGGCWWMMFGTGLSIGVAMRWIGRPGLMRFGTVGALMSVYAVAVGSMVSEAAVGGLSDSPLLQTFGQLFVLVNVHLPAVIYWWLEVVLIPRRLWEFVLYGALTAIVGFLVAAVPWSDDAVAGKTVSE